MIMRFRIVAPPTAAAGRRVLAGAVLLAALSSPVPGQSVVTTDDGQVVADGDVLRIESGTEEVDVDWRRGTVVVRDADDDVLVGLGAVRAADHILVPLAGDVLFELGSAAIDRTAAATLGRLAEVIRRHALGEVLVVGHTDSLGSEEANQRLSEERALAVVRWLHGHEGIPTRILAARGMGETRPVAPNRRGGEDDPAGRARNRRVEVVVGTTETADVRAIADGVTIRDGEVEVAGVRIAGGRVEIGAGAVGAASPPVAGGGGDVTCAAGRTCRADCPDGECRMDCSAGAICEYGCRGGNCVMTCASGANCDFRCAGGDCRFERGFASQCRTSCEGGGCRG